MLGKIAPLVFGVKTRKIECWATCLNQNSISLNNLIKRHLDLVTSEEKET